MLVELRLVEQRYQAVLEVLEGATVTDVARRFGVARQTSMSAHPDCRGSSTPTL
jgi:transposase